MKTVSDLLLFAEKFLQNNRIEDAHSEAREIVLFVTGFDRSEYLFHMNDAVSDDDFAKTELLVNQRVSGIPLQYLLGEWDFYGNTFIVFPGVLIPRPETEELTDLAISFIRENASKTVFDICAGTGCIGLSIAMACPDVEVYLFEFYDKPLQCIRQNAERFGLKNVHIVDCDVLQPPDDNIPQADVIISNPPYIPTAEMNSLQREVLQEPLTALDGGDDGLLFYRSIAEHWFVKLNNGGCVYFECAENQPSSVIDLFSSLHNNIEKAFGIKDFYGLDRFVFILKKG